MPSSIPQLEKLDYQMIGMIKILLSLDLSTTCTGFSVFNIETKELIQYKAIKPEKISLKNMDYPEKQLIKMVAFAEQLAKEIYNLNPDFIVIEEIAGASQRLGQKVLDGFHWLVLERIPDYLKKLEYYDVTGANGWRTHLGLRLSEEDKLKNKEAKILNKKYSPKIPIIGPKHLACRFANRVFKLNLDVDQESTDADIADSVCMGYAFLNKNSLVDK